jgi:hypothetical protein
MNFLEDESQLVEESYGTKTQYGFLYSGLVISKEMPKTNSNKKAEPSKC